MTKKNRKKREKKPMEYRNEGRASIRSKEDINSTKSV